MPFGEIILAFDLLLVAFAVLGRSGGSLAVWSSFFLLSFDFPYGPGSLASIPLNILT